MMERSFTLDLARLRNDPLLAVVEWHETLPSTNDYALPLAGRDGLNTPLLVIAGEQTAGRGRGNNRWWSQEGALTFTLVIEPGAAGTACLRTEHWPRVALIAGVALCEALEGQTPGLMCGLKWPNDVLIEGQKVAGILVEIPPAPAGIPRRLVLGMGVNVNNSLAGAPEEVATRGISLADAAGRTFEVTEILQDWLACFFEGLKALADEDPALPKRWQSRCALRGRQIELLAANQPKRGLCRGIGNDGALLVETEAGLERLYGGVLVRVSD